MRKNETKAAVERDVFRECAVAARLSVRLDSIESRLPPEPDILCDLAGDGLVAFELVQLVDQGLAHAIARTVANPESPQGTWFGDPTLERVRDKLVAKSYETPHPMELLAYGDDTLLPREIWEPSFAEPLRKLFDTTPSRFRRVWVVNLGRYAGADPVWLVHPPLAG